MTIATSSLTCKLSRGTFDPQTVPLPLTPAGLQASRLSARSDGRFTFATGTTVYNIGAIPSGKRNRTDQSLTDQPSADSNTELEVSTTPVTSAITDEYLIPRPFSSLTTSRDGIHSAHESEVQSVASQGLRTASVDAYGRCIITIDDDPTNKPKSTTNSISVRKSFVLPSVSLYHGEQSWCGVALRPNDTNCAAVARQSYRDVTMFDGTNAIRTFHTLLRPHALTFTDASQTLTVAEGNDIAQYDSRVSEQGGNSTRKQIGQARLLAIDASPDGYTIATCGIDRTVHIFDTRANAIRDRWANCLKYEGAGLQLSHSNPGLVYVCSIDNELACGAWCSATAQTLVQGEKSLMLSGASAKSPRRAFGFRADVRITGMIRRNEDGEEIGAVTESGAFYLLRKTLLQ